MVWLDRLLGLESDRPEASHGHYLAVLEADGCRYGLVVDDLMSPEEIVVEAAVAGVARDWNVFGSDGFGQWDAGSDPGTWGLPRLGPV